jgi:hypothetical protein
MFPSVMCFALLEVSKNGSVAVGLNNICFTTTKCNKQSQNFHVMSTLLDEILFTYE